MKATQLEKTEYITSGIAEVDALVKGFPRKRMTEIFGLQSVGKTTITLLCVAGLTKAKKKVLFIDSENSFNPDRAQELGVDLNYVDYTNTNLVEEVMEVCVKAVSKYDVIIVDSIAAMTTRVEEASEPGAANMGQKARLMGQFMRKVTAPLGKSNCALIFVNQLRQTMETYGAKYFTPGGNALKFHASLRLELTTTAKDRIMDGDVRKGHYVNVKIEKSKIGVPYRAARFSILYE